MRLIDADTFKAEGRKLYRQAGWDLREVHYSQLDMECNIDMMPTVDPVKHGRWEKDGEIMMFGDIPVKCSQCGFKTLQDASHRMDYHYCPNCGARMDESED